MNIPGQSIIYALNTATLHIYVTGMKQGLEKRQ